MKYNKILKSNSIRLIIVSVSVWLASSIIDNYLFKDKMMQNLNFLDVLMLNVPEMLLFHRILYVFIIAFISSLILLIKAHNRLKLSEQKLSEANRTKDKLFAMISHDFRSPFSGYFLLSDILISKNQELKKGDIKKIGEDIKSNTRNIYNFFDNLLLWAKNQMNQTPIKPAKLELKSKIDDIVKVFSLVAQGKNIKIHNDADSILKVYCDDDMFSSIIRNLLSNALKFTNQGGTIKISTSQYDEDRIIISVADNGIGMSEDKIQKLFKIGEKISSRGTSNEEGTGLGLILVNDFVQKNYGSISVKSELGKGTTFNVTMLCSN